MDFSGIDKLTIIDFPSKVACILFYKGCNFQKDLPFGKAPLGRALR